MPYVYLSPGEFNIPCDWMYATALWHYCQISGSLRREETTLLESYSGGFADGGWAVFAVPRLLAPSAVFGVHMLWTMDIYVLFYHAEVLCIYQDAWDGNDLEANIRTFDLSLINSVRGFSDAIRVSRFAYLAPLSDRPLNYAYRLVRVYLGDRHWRNVGLY